MICQQLKKKFYTLFFLLFFGWLFIPLFIMPSTSLAYSWDDFVDFLEINKDNYSEPNMVAAINLLLPRIGGAADKLTNSGYNLNNYKTFYCQAYKLDYTYTVIIYCYEYDDVQWTCLQNNEIQFNTTNKYEVQLRFNYGTKYDPNSWGFQNPNRQIRSSGNVNHVTGLFNTEPYNGIYYDSTIVNQYYITTTYLEFVNSHIDNTTYNNGLFTYYYQGDFYDSSQVELGSILPNDSYYYEVYLKENSNNLVKGTCFVDVNLNTIFNGDGALFIDNNQNVYIIPRYLKYNRQYRLEITSYYGDGGNDLYEDIDWFIFLPMSAIVTSGDILSFGSGENYDLQNSVNDTIDFYTDSSEVDSIINTYLSGDSTFLSSELNYPSINNSSWFVIYNFVQGLCDTLNSSGDVYFDYSMHGETPIRIYSSSFTTPNGTLKTFVTLSMVFGTLFILYIQFKEFIDLLNTGRIIEAVKHLDSDENNLYRM